MAATKKYQYKVKPVKRRTYIVSYAKQTGWGEEMFDTMKAAVAFGKKKRRIFMVYVSDKYIRYS